MANRAFPPWFGWFLESPVRLWMLPPATLMARLPLAPDFTVVEIGSGTGVYARAIRPRVRHLVGVELQRGLIEQARARDASLLQVQASALALPMPSGTVDLVYLVTVLGEVTDQAEALREMHRVLRPGGFLAIAEHLPDPDYVCVAEAFARALCLSGLRIPEDPRAVVELCRELQAAKG